MVTLHSIQQWGTTHHPRWFVVLRVALGVCLIAKGIVFISNNSVLEQLIAGSSLARDSGWLPIVITWAHLLGGFLFIIGLLTRWVALLQIPILVGAIFFINTSGSELSLAVVVLLLLIFFLVEGGGPLSLDNYFQRNPR